MPCYLRGVLRLTNFERLQQEASKLGLELRKDLNLITIIKDGVRVSSALEEVIVKGGNAYFKETMRNYNIQQVKVAAMRKGWKFEMVKAPEGKLVMRISE